MQADPVHQMGFVNQALGHLQGTTHVEVKKAAKTCMAGPLRELRGGKYVRTTKRQISCFNLKQFFTLFSVSIILLIQKGISLNV